jgi:hypothetical protein
MLLKGQVLGRPLNAGSRERGVVKKVMKNHSGEYGKTRKTFPLEGGGKRVGVKGLSKGVGSSIHNH